MNRNLKLDRLNAPLRVLHLLATDFGHLPAPSVQVSPVFPEHLELCWHGDLSQFEAWREALGIEPDAVEYREHEGWMHVLKASVLYAGAVVELVGYSDVVESAPAPAVA